MLNVFVGITPKTSAELIPDSDPAPTTPVDVNEVMSTLNTQLEKLYAALPPRTAVVIFTGHSDPRKMSELNARKVAFEAALRQGKSLDDVGKDNWWTTVDGRELEEEVEKAKRGLLFLGVKESS